MNKTIKINEFRVKYEDKVNLKNKSEVEKFLEKYYFNTTAYRILEKRGCWYAINESELYKYEGRI